MTHAADRGSRPGTVTVVLGVLATLVALVLLAEPAPAVTLPVVGVLVVALGVVGLLAARAGAMTTAASVLWFTGVVTGLGHLLRSAVGEPTGVGSVGTGLVTTAVWAVLVWFLRRPTTR